MRKSFLSLDTHKRCASLSSDDTMAPPTYTNKSNHRRSMISMDAFKPGRGKLHKLWSQRNSVSCRDGKDWSRSDLSSAVHLAGTQMGAIGNPAHPMPAPRIELTQDDVAFKDDLERLMEEETIPSPQASIATPAPSYAPPSPPTPPPMYHPYCPPALAAPMRISPPAAPSIPELSDVNYDAEEERDTAMPIVSPLRPMSTFRRRAKTPVHSIGQLEQIKRKQLPVPPTGLNRTSSVSTIAREYRDLVQVPEELEAEPVRNPNYTHFDSTDSDHDASSQRSSQESQRNEPSELSDSTSDWQESRLAICLGSDDGTLVDLEERVVEGAPHLRPLSLTPPTTPPLRQHEVQVKPQEEEEEESVPTPTTLRFRIGLELLTRELSSAMSRGSNDASGLQIWVMIEAYERLRDQIAATSPENEEARRAIDSWVEALHAIHKNMANETGAIASR